MKLNNIYQRISFNTKFGWITVIVEDKKILEIKFKKMKKQLSNTYLLKFESILNKFFLKKTYAINFPYRIEGSKVQKMVWKEIKNIQYGKTKTYGEIAKKLKLSPRHVGKICGQNKLLLIIPCHRVIRSDGQLGGFSAKGGISLKKKLLNFEKNCIS